MAKRKTWSADDLKAIKGIGRHDIEAIKEVAKRLGRTYASVYIKVWAASKGKLKKASFRKKVLPDVTSKVRMTKHYVIVRDYKSISLLRGAVRIKL